MKKQQEKFTVSICKKVAKDYLYLELLSNKNLGEIQAGQFANLEIPNSKKVYLRRPFSIHDVNKNKVAFLIKIIGNGTTALTKLKKHDVVSVVLPLGNGFQLVSGKALLIGGGCGIAPLLLLAKQLKQAGAKPTIILGGRAKTDIVRKREFTKYGKVLVSTEDGSKGTKGYVTEVMKKLDLNQYQMLYTCGPEAMLRGIHKIASEKKLPLQVSLESMMACGFGVCLCCVTKTKNEGHLCVCKDGPVFSAERLSF